MRSTTPAQSTAREWQNAYGGGIFPAAVVRSSLYMCRDSGWGIGVRGRLLTEGLSGFG